MKNTPSVSNRKAYYDYHILEKFECGIELIGSEVKSLREAKASLADSFARIDNAEVFLYNMHINTFNKTGSFKEDPYRIRKLLLHKRQIDKLNDQIAQRGLTLVPLRIYFNSRGIAKVELGVAKGKRPHDKRETIKRRQTDLEIKRALENRR